MIIMGIDPGTIKAGYGVIAAEGSEIRPIAFGIAKGGSRRKDQFALRLKNIYEGLAAVITAEQPELIVLESIFFHKNVQSAIKIGEGRGVAILAAAQAGIDIAELTPTVIKKAVTGRGDARKEQVGEMVRLILGLEEIPQPDDAADALACAIAGYHRQVAGERMINN